LSEQLVENKGNGGEEQDKLSFDSYRPLNGCMRSFYKKDGYPEMFLSQIFLDERK
jgi:hypothetical protein